LVRVAAAAAVAAAAVAALSVCPIWHWYIQRDVETRLSALEQAASQPGKQAGRQAGRQADTNSKENGKSFRIDGMAARPAANCFPFDRYAKSSDPFRSSWQLANASIGRIAASLSIARQGNEQVGTWL
jgi:hypothetical protein